MSAAMDYLESARLGFVLQVNDVQRIPVIQRVAIDLTRHFSRNLGSSADRLVWVAQSIHVVEVPCVGLRLVL